MLAAVQPLAGGFHADEWPRNGIIFKPSAKTTSENYLHALPMLLWDVPAA